MAANALYSKDAKASAYSAKAVASSAAAAELSDDENDSESKDSKLTVILREPARGIRSDSPTQCVEDGSQGHCVDPSLQDYLSTADGTVSKSPIVPWTEAYDSDQKTKKVSILPPFSSINYANRIRTKRLTFTVTATPAGGIINQTGSSFMATKLPASLATLLFDCRRSQCKHTILPLRLSLASYALQHVSPLTPVRVQLYTKPHRFSGGDSHPREWLPENSGEVSTHYTDGAQPSTVDTAFALSLNPNTSIDLMSHPIPLYEVNDAPFSASHLDLQWLLGSARGLERYVRKGTAYNGESAIAYVKQPDPRTNRAPNWLSYFVTDQLADAARGTTVYKRDVFTHTDSKSKEALFRMKQDFYTKCIANVKIRYSEESRYIMDLSEGMWVTFKPTDHSVWNAYLRSQIERQKEDRVMMSVTFLMSYVILGPVS